MDVGIVSILIIVLLVLFVSMQFEWLYSIMTYLFTAKNYTYYHLIVLLILFWSLLGAPPLGLPIYILYFNGVIKIF